MECASLPSTKRRVACRDSGAAVSSFALLPHYDLVYDDRITMLGFNKLFTSSDDIEAEGLRRERLSK